MQVARKLRVQKTVIAESAEVHPPPLSQREGGGCRVSEDQIGEPLWRPTGEPKEAGPVGDPGEHPEVETKSGGHMSLKAIFKPEGLRSSRGRCAAHNNTNVQRGIDVLERQRLRWF